jgi:hypothetical protein
MAKSLVLHIGDPKTGTSSIQEVLLRGLWQSPSVKVAYPNQLNSFPLANALTDPKQAEHLEARFTRLANWVDQTDADVAVVSAEQFFRVDPKELFATLTQYLPDHAHSMRVIAYVRPHADRFVSAFMQRIKAGMFQGDMDTFFQKTQGEGLLNFTPRFMAWRQVFGDRFTLRPMIRSRLRDGDVVSDFLDLVVNGAPFRMGAAVDANPSLPLEPLVAVREVQAILMRNRVLIGTRHSVGDKISRLLAMNQAVLGTKLRLSQKQLSDIDALCRPDAKALDAAFFDGQPLMTDALRDAVLNAVPEAQDMAAESHYSSEDIMALRKEARMLVTLFKKRPMAWTMAFERDIGQRPGNDAKPPPPPVRQHNAKVDATLARIADLIGGGSDEADR